MMRMIDLRNRGLGVLVALLLFVSVALVACGGGTPASTSNSQPATPASHSSSSVSNQQGQGTPASGQAGSGTDPSSQVQDGDQQVQQTMQALDGTKKDADDASSSQATQENDQAP